MIGGDGVIVVIDALRRANILYREYKTSTPRIHCGKTTLIRSRYRQNTFKTVLKQKTEEVQ